MSMSSCSGTTWGTLIPPSPVSANVTRCSAPSRAASTSSGRWRAIPAAASEPTIPAKPWDQLGIWLRGSRTNRSGMNSQSSPAAVSCRSASSTPAACSARSPAPGTWLPERQERTEQDGRGAQGRVVATPLRDRARRPDPRGLPPVGRGELVQPRDDHVDAGSLQCGQDAERAGQAVEVVVLGLRRHAAYQRLGDAGGKSLLADGQVAGEADLESTWASPPMPLCMP